MTLNKTALLTALRSYADAQEHPHHFHDDIHYTLKDSRWHLTNPQAPQALIGHLEGAARGEHKLHVFGYQRQEHDGSEMNAGMTPQESAATAATWGVANRAELLKRLTAGLPGIPDDAMHVSDPQDSADWDDHHSFLDNLKYTDHDADDWDYSVSRNDHRGGVYMRTQSVPIDQDVELDEDGEEIEQEPEYEDREEYYDAATGNWGDDDVWNVLKPTSSVQIKHPSIGSMTRDITHDSSGDKVGYQHYWEASETGSGLSSLVYQSNFEAYEAAGCDKVTVHANISVGGYAWARHGFDEDSDESHGDLDGFKRTLTETLEELHRDHGSGASPNVLAAGPAQVWQDQMASGETPDEWATPDDVREEVRGRRLYSGMHDELAAYHEHHAAGRTTDAEIGAHVLAQSADDIPEWGGDDPPDAEDRRNLESEVKDVLDEKRLRDRRLQRDHEFMISRHTQSVQNHELAKKYLEDNLPPDERAAKLLEGETRDPDITPERWRELAEGLIARDRPNWERKHAQAIEWADPVSIVPHPGEYAGPRPHTPGEVGAAIAHWRTTQPEAEEEPNAFTQERLEELTDVVDNISYMHELASFTLPRDVYDVLAPGSRNDLLGKQVLKGSSWHGTYPLSGMRDAQVRAGNMYRAAKLMERATADHSRGTTVQAEATPKTVRLSIPVSSGEVATDPGVDFAALARATRALTPGQQAAADAYAAKPNPWGDLGVSVGIRDQDLRGKNSVEIGDMLRTHAPGEPDELIQEAVKQWQRHVIGTNPYPAATWRAFSAQHPTAFVNETALRIMGDHVIGGLDQASHDNVQAAWRHQLQYELARQVPADVALGREIVRSTAEGIPGLKDRTGRPFVGSDVHPAVNTTEGQRAIGAAWTDERASYLLDGRRTPEQNAYEDAFDLTNMQQGPVSQGPLTDEQVARGLEQGVVFGNPVARSHPELFKEWLTRHHDRRLRRAARN